jgi:hypothetical protein
MAKIVDFLEKLASDEDFEAGFLADPEGVMAAFGLNQHQMDLILTGTAKKIHNELKQERPGAESFAIRLKMG